MDEAYVNKSFGVADGKGAATTEAVSANTLLQMATDSLQAVRETQAHLEQKHNMLFGASLGKGETEDKPVTDNLYTVLRQIGFVAHQNLKLSQSL